MKAKLLFAAILAISLLAGCNLMNKKTAEENKEKAITENPILGKWIRIGPGGVTVFDFKENGLVEGDFGNDQTIDVIDEYEISNDTVSFKDKEGQMCEGFGTYKIYQTDYYVAFDLINDDCGGRVKTTMGFWVRPDYNALLDKLGKEIEETQNPELNLNRARMFMAIGDPMQARPDFDVYIEYDSTDSRAYVNRAGTRFPNDMEGVVFDCNKAISLEPGNKNAYFLRGLARYELGEKEQACEDFSKAIELGFSVLRSAEYDKCAEFWGEEE